MQKNVNIIKEIVSNATTKKEFLHYSILQLVVILCPCNISCAISRLKAAKTMVITQIVSQKNLY